MKTDNQLQQDINAELKWKSAINARFIRAEVKNGIITLVGHVSSYSERLNAERIVQRITGIKNLKMNVDVKLAESSHRNDADIAHAAEQILNWSTYLPDNSINILVRKAWLTLTGHVRWDFERRGAATAVSDLIGITGISNQILITEKRPSEVLQADIEATLKRRAQNDDRAFAVMVNGADVTLSGTVHSWEDRDLASHAAWSSPGVWSVLDNIAVAY